VKSFNDLPANVNPTKPITEDYSIHLRVSGASESLWNLRKETYFASPITSIELEWPA
jgi:hypothetical protein